MYRGIVYKFLITLSLLLSLISLSNSKGIISIILRYDDYSNESPSELEEEIFSTVNAFGIKLTVGIIPFINQQHTINDTETCLSTLNEEKISLLKKYFSEGNIEIALHGFSHNLNREGISSEFFGIDYEEQYYMLKKGKSTLEEIFGLDITTFIPPWNTFDSNTVRATKNLGFRIISTSYMPSLITKQLNYLNLSEIIILPVTCEFKDLESTIKKMQLRNIDDILIVALFHPFDFLKNPRDINSGIDYAKLDKFENLLKSLSLDKRINFKLTKDITAYENMHKYSFERFIKYSKFRQRLTYLPLPFNSKDKNIYLTEELLDSLNKTVTAYLILFFGLLSLAITIISISIGKYINKKKPNLFSIIKIFFVILFLFASIYALKDFDISPQGSYLLASLGSTVLGFLLIKKA